MDSKAGTGPRLSLIAIAAAAAIPILLFAVVMVFDAVSRERAAVEEKLWRASRDALTELDKMLANHFAALTAMSSLVDSDDFGGIYSHAGAILKQEYAWNGIRLIDTRTGTIDIDVTAPGTPPPDPNEVREIVQSGRPTATIRSGQGDPSEPVLLLKVPVRRGERIDHVLTAAIDADRVSALLAAARVPESWTVAAIDPNFLIAGRNRRHERFAGTPVTPSLRAEIERSNEGYFYALNKEGDRVYTLFVRSPFSRWTIAIGAPAAMIERPVFWSGLSLVAAGGSAVLIAVLLAVTLARNFERRQAAEAQLAAFAAEAETERRLTEIARNFPGVIYRRVRHPDGRISYPFVSDGVAQLLGLAPDRLQEPLTLADLTRMMQPASTEDWQQELERSARELTPYQIEGWVRRGDGDVRWLRSVAVPHRRNDGSVVWDGVALDITDEKRREQLLREQTEVLDTLGRLNAEVAGELNLERLVRLVAEAATRLTGAEFGAFFYHQPGPEGRSRLSYEVAGPLAPAFAAMPMPRGTEIFRPTFVGGDTTRLGDVTQDPRYGKNPPFHGPPPGHPPVRSYLAVPVISRSGRVAGSLFLGHREPDRFTERGERIVIGIAAQAAIAIDNARLYRDAQEEIQERRRVEEQQELLMAELDHRVRNILAVVQSLAGNTLPPGPELDVYRGRIRALAQAHGLLAQTKWQGAGLSELVRTEIAPYADGAAERIAIDGDDVLLRPAAAQTLVLAVHELTTNAAKYGALSRPDGRVRIAWKIAPEGTGRAWLRLTWTERGGPPVTPPEQAGFGRALIERGVRYSLSGEVAFDFAPDGLRCEIRIPLDQAAPPPR